MGIRSTSTFVALVVSASLAAIAAAGPVQAGGLDRDGGKETRVVVLDDVRSEVTVGELQKVAQDAAGEKLPGVSEVTAVAAEKDQLTPEQLVTLLDGKEAPGVKRLGSLEKPTEASTLNELARAAGGIIVIGWRCYIVIRGGYWYLVCIPVVIIRA
jgi:hypothetical protein